MSHGAEDSSGHDSRVKSAPASIWLIKLEPQRKREARPGGDFEASSGVLVYLALVENSAQHGAVNWSFRSWSVKKKRLGGICARRNRWSIMRTRTT